MLKGQGKHENSLRGREETHLTRAERGYLWRRREKVGEIRWDQLMKGCCRPRGLQKVLELVMF